MTVYKIQNVNKHLLIQQIADLDNLLSDANDVANDDYSGAQLPIFRHRSNSTGAMIHQM